MCIKENIENEIDPIMNISNVNIVKSISKNQLLVEINGDKREYMYKSNKEIYKKATETYESSNINLKGYIVGNINFDSLDWQEYSLDSREIDHKTSNGSDSKNFATDFTLEDVIFVGKVNLTKMYISGKTVFNNVIFLDEVNIEETDFEKDWRFEKCYFKDKVNLNQTNVAEIKNCYFKKGANFTSLKNLKRVECCKFFDTVTFDKVTNSSSIKDLELCENKIFKSLTIKNSTQENLRISKSDVYSNFHIINCNIIEYITMIEVTVHETMRLEEIRITKSPKIRECVFSGDLDLIKINMIDNIYLDKVKYIGYLTLNECHINDRLILDMSKIHGIGIKNIINDGIINIINLATDDRQIINTCKEYNHFYRKMYLRYRNETNYKDDNWKLALDEIFLQTLLVFKNNANKINNYELEDSIYYEYKKESIKPKYKKRNRLTNKIWLIYDYVLGYCIGGFGTKPGRIFLTMVVLILFFAFLYYANGIESLMNESNSNIKITNPIILAIYFSAITFFTVGYGDVSAWSNTVSLLVIVEAFMGVFLMAYLSVAFVRKLLRE